MNKEDIKYKIIATKCKIRFLEDNWMWAISKLHYDHQVKHLKYLKKQALELNKYNNEKT